MYVGAKKKKTDLGLYYLKGVAAFSFCVLLFILIVCEMPHMELFPIKAQQL